MPPCCLRKRNLTRRLAVPPKRRLRRKRLYRRLDRRALRGEEVGTARRSPACAIQWAQVGQGR